MDSAKPTQQPYWTQRARDRLERARALVEVGKPEEAREEAEEAVKALDRVLLEPGPTSPSIDPSPTSAAAVEP